MEILKIKSTGGGELIRSTFLLAAGLLFIPLGLTWVPGIGLLVGVGLVVLSLSPLAGLLRTRRVEVLIDPVSDNYLNERLVAVAVLSSHNGTADDFDAARIDPATVVFGPLKARPLEDMKNAAIHARNLQDVNDDGRPDLLLYFSADEAGITAESEECCVRGRTYDGVRFTGCSGIVTVCSGEESELLRWSE